MNDEQGQDEVDRRILLVGVTLDLCGKADGGESRFPLFH
jgi:hypothetical protein